MADSVSLYMNWPYLLVKFAVIIVSIGFYLFDFRFFDFRFFDFSMFVCCDRLPAVAECFAPPEATALTAERGLQVLTQFSDRVS